ncbi:hypothetical protein IMZ48_00765 [Candidatus Bathyarchaeota archaeon]|nr:hypothetical protein [Candidatus Bathyarchaeota archaeon]
MVPVHASPPSTLLFDRHPEQKWDLRVTGAEILGAGPALISPPIDGPVLNVTVAL